MNEELQIFKGGDSNEIRAITIKGKSWLVGVGVASALPPNGKYQDVPPKEQLYLINKILKQNGLSKIEESPLNSIKLLN
jgi:prophage antirepressor-like protein